MDILLAKPRSFCAGVKRAAALVEAALAEHGAPVHVLHEIVHNTHVLNRLRALGAVFVESLDEIPAGGLCIFSAHGVAKSVEEEARRRGLSCIDATCPLVARVHRRLVRLRETGHHLVILGHKGHPEVEGARGQVEAPVHVISRPEEAAALPLPPDARLGCVTQTTLSLDDAARLLAALRARFPGLAEPEHSDICYATSNRQRAVRRLAEDCDLVLIVGSKNSSNSNRLREVAEAAGTPAHLIDDAGELDPAWLDGVKRVGVSAGASAPEHLVQELTARLRDLSPGRVEEMEGEDEAVRFPPRASPGRPG